MAENILVKTPLTSDGVQVLLGPDGKRVYSESILKNQGGPNGAKAILEKRNAGLPENLRVIIEDYDGPVGVKAANEPPPVEKKTVKNVTT